MPVRNVVRYKAPETYYHVYNRGHNKDLLFIDEDDYKSFLFLLERSFGPVQLKDQSGRQYPWFGDQVLLHAYCLMPNHFHLLLYQQDNTEALSRSMQSLATTYSMYFNRKYKRRGSIFESAFKASPVLEDKYLQHITRYIHLNPKDFIAWKYSSYKDYLGSTTQPWVNSKPILGLFDNRAEYKRFVDDYVEMRDELAELKYELADFGETY